MLELSHVLGVMRWCVGDGGMPVETKEEGREAGARQGGTLMGACRCVPVWCEQWMCGMDMETWRDGLSGVGTSSGGAVRCGVLS